MLEEVTKGLASFLSERWGAQVDIQNAQMASAGARRLNLLFDAVRAGETTPLVATIIPNPAMQVQDIAVEARTLALAEKVGARVPHVYEVCNEKSAVGGPFFLTARIDGETIPRRVLRLVEATPGLGAKLARDCGETLAKLHAIDPATAPTELMRPGDAPPAEHALVTVEPLMRGLLQPSPSFELAMRWLDRYRPPAPTRNGLLHGDFRTGNLIVGPEGLCAALDWEIARIGDGMEDVAWLCMRMWRFRNDALEVGGFAVLSELREGYEAAGGSWNGDAFHWWKIMSTLKWGLGLAGQAAAHLDGSVPSIVMAASGRRVAELEYDLLMLMKGAYSR